MGRVFFCLLLSVCVWIGGCSQVELAELKVRDVTVIDVPVKVSDSLSDRIEGLLIGSFIGDAFGGPVEFQELSDVQKLADPPKLWGEDEVLDSKALAECARRFRLRPYGPLRRGVEPYGQWSVNAAAGTVTDDSRHKMILLDALAKAEAGGKSPFGVPDLARGYVDWSQSKEIHRREGYCELCEEWLGEYMYATQWVLGERNVAVALPPERMWNGLATCCGQMGLLPLAAIHAGNPEDAYRTAYGLAYYDNGWGKDMNAALVAGLAAALVVDVRDGERVKTWKPVLKAIGETDPYRYGEIPWVERSVDKWMGVADGLVREAQGRPGRLFAGLEREFAGTIKWEAQVPFVVAFAVLALADYDPLAAMELSIEWGHDTDSYAQLVGAFVGAVYGAGVFDAEIRETVETRLEIDYGVDFKAYVRLLERLYAKEQCELAELGTDRFACE